VEERTKQRLVGGLVFVGALFIVLPFLFHNARPSLVDKVDQGNTPLAQQQPSSLSSKPAPILADNNPLPSAAMQPTADQNAQSQPVNADPSIPSSTTTPATPDDATSTNSPQTVNANPSNNQNAGTPPSSAPAQAPQAATPAQTGQNPTVIPSIMPGAQQPASPTQAVPSAPTNAMPAQPIAPAPAATDATASQSSAPTPAQQNQSHAQPSAAPNTAVASTVKSDFSKNVAIAKPAKLAAHDRITEGWTIQVGAFSERKNVARIVAQLKAHHFHVYEKELRSGGRPLIAVYVGPERNLDHIRLAQDHLRSELNMNGEIKKYEAHSFS